MKTIMAIVGWVLAFAIFVAWSSCASLRTAFTGCGSAEAKAIAADLLPAVVDILRSPDYQTALEKLATRLGGHGMDLIVCVVQEIAGQRISGAGEPIVKEHAQSFLVAHGKGGL